MTRILRAASMQAGLSPFSMADARAEGEALRAAARRDAGIAGEEARRMLEAARREAEGVRAQAREEGLAQGREEGLARGREEGAAQAREAAEASLAPRLEEARRLLDDLLTGAHEALEPLQREAEGFLVRFSLAIARKILGHEARTDPGRIERALREAWAGGLRGPDLQVRVHPDLLQDLTRDLPRLRKQVDGIAGLSLVADPGVEPGGCVVQGAGGFYDAQWGTVLEALERHLVGEEGGGK